MDENDGKFTFITFNVNGASHHEKQKDIFDYLRKKKFDIMFLQEMHCKDEAENIIRSRWGYNCFICGKSNSKKGVAILFNNTFTYKLHKIVKDENDGSFLVLDITIFNERYTLVNVYGPSDKDDPDFFVKLTKIIDDIGNRQVIAAGDWNVILDPSLDVRNYKSLNPRPRSRRVIKEMIDNCDLFDVFRTVYPSKRQYTWRRFNTIQQGRLDYFLISDSLVTEVKNIEILPGYRSDHSIVCLSLKNQITGQRPKGYWKFNNSLLRDIEYVNQVKKIIQQTIIQYMLPVYDIDYIKRENYENIQFCIDDQLFYEILLLEIRGLTIKYSSNKKKKR